MDEVSKRRRMPLSPLADENVDNEAVTAEKNDVKQDKVANAELSRREKLLKWREERKQKKGAEPQKKSFVVRHVKYEQEALLFASAMKKATKGAIPLMKPSQYEASKPAKRVTRASVRIAKQSENPATDFKTRSVKKVEPKPKAVCSDKLEEKKTQVQPEKTGRVTRQSVRTKQPSTTKGITTTSQSSKKAMVVELDNKVKTRSQAQKVKDQASSESHHPSKLDKQRSQVTLTEEIIPGPEKLSFPPLENIKNTVSLGRGSTEGVERGPQPSTVSRTEDQSFAPENFQFTVPSGVNSFTYFAKAFKFQPLSPKSAAEFMFPTSAASFFSPKRDKPTDQVGNAILEDPIAACHLNNEPEMQENNPQEQGDHEMIDDVAGACTVAMETCNTSEKQQGHNIEAVETISNTPATDRETPSTQKPLETISEVVTGMDDGNIETQEVEEEQHDSKYFRNLVTQETDRLNEICTKWEKINAEEQGLSEEVTGQIRTTVGQAQLLIDQRFRQFSGLIDLSEDKQAEKPATASDLQGFWEMIYFQVEDVNAKFDALEKLKSNNWQEEEKKTEKITKKSKAKKPMPGNDGKPNKKLAATRNKIQEMRMAMKAKMAADKERLRAEKRHQEEEAFVTILTPVKKSIKSDGSDEVVLTPVRRSIRKTPQKRSVLRNNTPVVVTTPKIISENSPGLRLTPDNHLNELAITGTCMQVDETHEGAARGEDLQPQEDEMQCDLQQQEPVVLKSACKSAENKSRKPLGTVSFQSPNPEETTPESALHEVFSSPVVSIGLDSTGSFENRPKKSTPQRFSARKCRSRMGTPYYQERPRRRVSTVEEDAGHGTDSQSRSSSDSDSTDDKASQRCPGSRLRRSARKTPSKYRDSIPLEAASVQQGQIPAEVSIKLFQATKESTAQETPKNDTEQDEFFKYLCPSSDEENCEKQTVDFDHKATENLLQADKETLSEDLDVNENVNLTPPEEPHNFIKPSVLNSGDPKTGRTPIHILRYLSEMDTPSPNSRHITPMPKTTIFVSPSDSTKTPALTDSLGMMSPENVVRRFPAKTDGSPLLSLAPVAVTPCSEIAAFSLDDSPVNNEKRRDSVFFAPISTAAVRAQDNLMSFSPVVEGNEAEV